MTPPLPNPVPGDAPLTAAEIEEPPAISVGQIVYNLRWCRWGQVTWDARRYQFETGQPMRVMVYEFDRRGTMDWPIEEIGVILSKSTPEKAWKKMVWQSLDCAPRCPNPSPYFPPDPQQWRRASDEPPLPDSEVIVALVGAGSTNVYQDIARYHHGMFWFNDPINGERPPLPTDWWRPLSPPPADKGT